MINILTSYMPTCNKQLYIMLEKTSFFLKPFLINYREKKKNFIIFPFCSAVRRLNWDFMSKDLTESKPKRKHLKSTQSVIIILKN